MDENDETEIPEGVEVETNEEKIKKLERANKKLSKNIAWLIERLTFVEEKHKEDFKNLKEKYQQDIVDIQEQFHFQLENLKENQSNSGITEINNREENRVIDLVRASNVRIPILKNLEKQSIRKFIEEYDNYKRLVPLNARLSIQDLISEKLVNIIKKKNNDMADDRYDQLDYLEMVDSLCKVHQCISYNQSKERLYLIKMKNDSISMDVILDYIEDFGYEIKFNGVW
jgi:hypothetical protein